MPVVTVHQARRHRFLMSGFILYFGWLVNLALLPMVWSFFVAYHEHVLTQIAIVALFISWPSILRSLVNEVFGKQSPPIQVTPNPPGTDAMDDQATEPVVSKTVIADVQRAINEFPEQVSTSPTATHATTKQ